MSWLTGLGAEGELKVKQTSGIATMDTVVISLAVPSASIAGDIKEFTTTAYWAKPNGDGFLVPKNKQRLGGAPWFPTFKVAYNPQNNL